MVDFSAASFLKSKLYRALDANSRALSPEELAKSGIIFSPHFDDETLGCGGTIIKKTSHGADVKVVFMTDGSRSHNQWMREEDLCALRRSEGNAAADKLGVKHMNVRVLGFPETRLPEYSEQVSKQVRELLLSCKPEQIFIPYAGEPLMWSSDHVTTTRIIRDAIRICSWPLTVYEYPIWAWFHFPWINIQRKHFRSLLRNSFYYRFGLRILKDINILVDVSNELDQKRIALEQHRSQMTELIPGVGWPTLGQVAGGDFLRIFFQKKEYYKAYRFENLERTQ